MAPFFKPGSELYRRFYAPSLDPIQTAVGDPMDVAGPTIIDPTGYLDPVSGFTQSDLPQGPTLPGGLDGWGPIISAVGERLLGQQMPDFGDVQSGSSTVGGGLACWKPTKTGKLQKRAQVRIVRDPVTGAPTLVKYCRPKRMNPLNPRALGRAARRLGSFHNIAQHIEKQIQHACRSGIGRRRSAPRLPSSCGPRKRCR